MVLSTLFRISIAGIFISTLVSCGGEQVSDLQSYIKNVKARQKARVEPLPEPVIYESYAYVKNTLRDPFAPKSKTIASKSNSTVKFQCRAPRDVLEGFPLDSLKMVGVLEQKGSRWALIKGKDGTLYRTKKGRCMGQNDGKIINITESEVILMETVEDGLGGLMKRKTVLSASE